MRPVITIKEMVHLVGETIGVSEWFEVSQERIDKFAEATEDFQFIHLDPEAAAKTAFGGTIAHGFLTLALIPALLERSDFPLAEGRKMGVNYGGNKTRFLAPLRSGRRVRGRFKLLQLEEKRPRQWQQTVEVTIEIEGQETPAIVTEWILQFFV